MVSLLLLQTLSQGEFRFASSQGNRMVLQMAPQQATLWGFVDPGGSVSVHFKGEIILATTATWLNQSTWLAKLPATEGGTAGYNITATSGSSTITLSDVLFGDVFVCSGQSNSESPLHSQPTILPRYVVTPLPLQWHTTLAAERAGMQPISTAQRVPPLPSASMAVYRTLPTRLSR